MVEKSVMPSMGLLMRIPFHVTRYPVDGALYGFYSSDSWVGALQKTMVKVIEAETGVPHFYIEGDLWALGGEARETRLAIVRSICNYLKISNI